MDIFDIEENLNEELKKDYKGQKDGFVQVGKCKWFYPSRYRKVANDLKNFEVRPDDIWITGFPRSGTTLTEELVWLLSHDKNIEEAKSKSVSERVPFFELDMVLNEKTVEEIIEKFPQEAATFQKARRNLQTLREMKDRRVIKTHLPFQLLPEDIIDKGCKVVYVCRNPKDVCVSYHFLQSNNSNMNFQSGFEKYWKNFRDGYCTFGPYFEHVKQGYDRIGSKHFLFVFYEEFRQDKEAYIKKLSEFLELPISNEEMKTLMDFIDFNNFRKVTDVKMKNTKNEPINFIRRGKVGGWRDYFTEEINREADEWIKKNTERIGIKYPQHD